MSSHSQKVSDPKQSGGNALQNNEESIEPTNPPSNDVEESAAVPKTSKSGKCRKNDPCIQQALRSLNRMSTPEEKFTTICAKYADIFDENRKLQAALKEHQKQITALTKEKDQTRSELMKAIFTKDKLENLCRELQRQNKEIKEESLQKIRDEEQKRKEVSSKFQTTLNEITELMKQDSDKTMKLRDDNIDMTSKLKSIYEQYEIREQQTEKMAKQMALESQLYEAKIAKLEMETAAEKEVLLREKQQLLLTLTEYQARFQEYQNIEVTLRNQVALYNNKYEEFEKSLTRSNEVFGGFKTEMENMSNKIVKLESETVAWKLRWEKTQKALIEMASEKQKSDQEIILAAKQMATLHKLCRTLQSERTQLLARLKHSSENTAKGGDTNSADDVGNLLESKIIDENLEISESYADSKNSNCKSKTRNKAAPQQIADKSPSVPKTKSKADKKQPLPSPNGNHVVVEVNGVENLIVDTKIDANSKKVDANHQSIVNADPLVENSNLVSVDESKVDGALKGSDAPNEQSLSSPHNSLSGENVELESKNEIRSLPDEYTNDAITRDVPSNSVSPENTSVASAKETEISVTKVTSEEAESVPQTSVQNNKKKVPQKKKNKK